MLRSLVVTLIIVAGQLITSVLAAYAFAFLRFPFKRSDLRLFMATLMLPLEVTLIANVETMRTLRWFNTYPGLDGRRSSPPLRHVPDAPGHPRHPPEISGCVPARRLRPPRVPADASPSRSPGRCVASFVVIAFLGAWNQYMWPRASSRTSRAGRPCRSVSRTFVVADPRAHNIAFAGALIAAVPILAAADLPPAPARPRPHRRRGQGLINPFKECS